jgi:hypothetical protein
MLSSISGYKLIEDPNLMESYQFRFPKSKNKRIQTKWRKRKRNWKSRPDSKFYIDMYYKTIIAHPLAMKALKKETEPSDYNNPPETIYSQGNPLWRL